MPWDHIQFDIKTDLPLYNGFNHILAVVDVFTGFVILRPLTCRSALAVIEELVDIFGVLGIPKIVQSDNEGAFISDMMTHFLRRIEAVQLVITPYVHRQLGKAESMVKLVANLVHKFCQISNQSWPRLIPLVTLALNQRISQLTGTSPYVLMFNRPPSILHKFSPPSIPDTGATPIQLHEWTLHQQRVLDEIFPAIRDRTAAFKFRDSQAYAKAKGNLLRPDLKLDVGSVVAIANEANTSKNAPDYIGPFTVQTVLSDGRYILTDMRTATRGNLFHRPATIDQLKILPYCRQKPEVEAEDGLWFPSHIVDHTGSRDSLRYHIRFLGKSPENDDWFTPSQLTAELIDPYKESLRIARARGRVLVQNLPDADIMSDSIHMEEKYDDPMQIDPQPLENIFEEAPQDPLLSSSSSVSNYQPILPDIPEAQLKSILSKRTSSGRLS